MTTYSAADSGDYVKIRGLTTSESRDTGHVAPLPARLNIRRSKGFSRFTLMKTVVKSENQRNPVKPLVLLAFLTPFIALNVNYDQNLSFASMDSVGI